MADRIIRVDDSEDSDDEFMFSCGTEEDDNKFARAIGKYRADSLITPNMAVDSSETNGVSAPITNGDGRPSNEAMAPPSENTTDIQKIKLNNKYTKFPTKHQNVVVEENMRKACQRGDLIEVEKCLSEGIGVNSALAGGWTPLMYACSSCCLSLVEFLLQNGSNPNYSHDRFCPLLALCSSSFTDDEKSLDCFLLLLEYRVHLNVQDTYQMTPLMFACKFGKSSLVKELLDHKVELDVQDRTGWSALTWAASRGFGAIVRMLLDSGANPNVINCAGLTPADVARDKEFDSVASLLESYCGGTSKLGASGDSRHDRNSVLKKCSEVDTILHGLNLAHLCQIFDQHEVNLEVYLALEEDDLEKMGIDKLGERFAIMSSIKTLHKERWEKTSLTDVHRGKYVTCPDAVAMVANIGSHLKLINSTIRYLRKTIKEDPSILEVGKESVHVKTFYLQSLQAQKYSDVLNKEFKYLNNELRRVENYAELLPADVIRPLSEKNWGVKGYLCVASCCGIIATLIFLTRMSRK